MNCGTYSDGIIALAYFSVCVSLFYVGAKRPDLAKGWIVWFFGPVFGMCGLGHAMHFLSLWHPWAHNSIGLVMGIQAAVSIPALLALSRVVQYITGAVSREQYEESLYDATIKARQIGELEKSIEGLRNQMLRST